MSEALRAAHERRKAVSGIGRVEATFQPHRTDDLRDEVRPFIGRRMEWEMLWLMDDEDPFPGEFACQPLPDQGWPSGNWVPDRDLAHLVLLSR